MRNQRFFSPLDRHFARFISGFQPAGADAVELAAALLSRAAGAGDVCLDMQAEAGRVLPEAPGAGENRVCPPLDAWVAALRRSAAVGTPGERRPLILDARHRLYLYRYWEYEHELVAAIRSRCAPLAEAQDAARLRRGLERVFGDPRDGADDVSQRLAAAVAAVRPFSVITGGPGTGKTYTIARVLALVSELAPGRPVRTLLAAPTGKAAARLQDALRRARASLERPERSAATGEQACTLHRLLKPLPDSPYFRHDRLNPLPADVVVVDEASMVDLALMAKLVDAVPPASRLVLVGDKDQLASVEAGSVLGDICHRDRRPGFSPAMAGLMAQATGMRIEADPHAAPGIQDGIVELGKSYRFHAGSAIGRLSRAVNAGDSQSALDILSGAADGALVWLDPDADADAGRKLEQVVLEGYRGCSHAMAPEQALAQHARFKILCAHKTGVFGVDSVNRMTERLLSRSGLIPEAGRSQAPWYAGRPVLVTRNDYALELFNGDIGVTLPEGPGSGGSLFVYFAAGDGGVRRYPPFRLPEHETVFAMTVHKSQGSEFDRVLLVLPERDSPVLTRELVYTALTRARVQLTIWGRRALLAAAIQRRIERTSGLRDALWG